MNQDAKIMEMKAQEHDVSDASVEAVAEVAEAVGQEAAQGNEKIKKGVVDGYKKIEKGVVDGYKKIETGVVDGFNKVTDKCVEVLFAHDGESVEDAKKRLRGENKEEQK